MLLARSVQEPHRLSRQLVLPIYVLVSDVMTKSRRSTRAGAHVPSSSIPRLSVQKGQENVFICRDNPALKMLQILILLSSKVPNAIVRETKVRGVAFPPSCCPCPSAPCTLPLSPAPHLPAPIPCLQPAVPTQAPCPPWWFLQECTAVWRATLGRT